MSGTGILSSRGIFNQQQCVYDVYSYCLIGDNGRLQYLRLFVEMYVNHNVLSYDVCTVQ